MRCEHCEAQLLDYAYEELDDGMRREVEGHLAGCESCQASLAGLTGTRQLMASLPEVEPQRGDEFILQAAAREARLRAAASPGWLARLGRWLAGHPVAATAAVAATVMLLVVSIDLDEEVATLKAAPTAEPTPAAKAPRRSPPAPVTAPQAAERPAETPSLLAPEDAPAPDDRLGSEERKAVEGRSGLAELEKQQLGDRRAEELARKKQTESLADETADLRLAEAKPDSVATAQPSTSAASGASAATGRRQALDLGGEAEGAGAFRDADKELDGLLESGKASAGGADAFDALAPGAASGGRAGPAAPSKAAPKPAARAPAPPPEPEPAPPPRSVREDTEEEAPSQFVETAEKASRGLFGGKRSRKDAKKEKRASRRSAAPASAPSAEVSDAAPTGAVLGQAYPADAPAPDSADADDDDAVAAAEPAPRRENTQDPDESVRSSLDRGIRLAAQGRCRDALPIFDRVLQSHTHPWRAEAYLERGRCLADLGRTEQARSDFAFAAALGADPWASRAQSELDALESGPSYLRSRKAADEAAEQPAEAAPAAH